MPHASVLDFLLFVENQIRFIVMGNLFCSEYPIHRRFDLKGSSHGRTTDKPEEDIDETTTLKDLDLNFVFRVQRNWFHELIKYVAMLVVCPMKTFRGFTCMCLYSPLILCSGKLSGTVSSWKPRKLWITVFWLAFIFVMIIRVTKWDCHLFFYALVLIHHPL